MIFPIGADWTVALPITTSVINNLMDKWAVFMTGEGDAIKELKSLESSAQTTELEQLRAKIANDLPDVSPSAIIDDGLLKNSSDPYRNYIESESKIWLQTAINNTIRSNQEKYSNQLKDRLKDTFTQAHLGKYLFEVKKFTLSAGATNGRSVDVHLAVDLEAKVIMDVDKSKLDIASDTVGLNDSANTVKNSYLGSLKEQFAKDIEVSYESQASTFSNNALSAAFRDLQSLLH